MWVESGGQRVSTLDLFQREWVLLADGDAWRLAPAAVQVLQLGAELVVDTDAFRRAFGLGRGGASLIRPDGYVAWRCPETPADPIGQLTAALASVSCAPGG